MRERDLPRLIRLWPDEILDVDRADHDLIIARLRRAIRSERQRGLAGDWTYDLNRHAALIRAYRAELAAGKQKPRAGGARGSGTNKADRARQPPQRPRRR